MMRKAVGWMWRTGAVAAGLALAGCAAYPTGYGPGYAWGYGRGYGYYGADYYGRGLLLGAAYRGRDHDRLHGRGGHRTGGLHGHAGRSGRGHGSSGFHGSGPPAGTTAYGGGFGGAFGAIHH